MFENQTRTVFSRVSEQSILVADSFEIGLLTGKECEEMEELNCKKSIEGEGFMHLTF